MKRNIYLKKKTLQEAKAVSSGLAHLIRLGTEVIPVKKACGRVTAEPVFAKISSPPFHCAAMDGIAVKAETTYGANEDSPRSLIIGKEAFFVNTGNPVPSGMDAVIMIEEVHLLGNQKVEIREGAYPWQHVRTMGEDMIATEMVLPANHKIAPYDLGALLASGNRDISVKKRPRVGILPTGSELVEPDQAPGAGPVPVSRIIESNSYVLSGLIEEDGGTPLRHPILKDDPVKIRESLLSTRRKPISFSSSQVPRQARKTIPAL